MRPYGLERWHQGCCPGHDKYPGEAYRNRRSVRAMSRGKKAGRRQGRRKARAELAQNACNGGD